MAKMEMTLKDISTGPDWILWAGFALVAILSIVLLSGRGANLIAGYNAASEEEKRKYDTKKLCRIVGGGLGIIALVILVMAVWEAVLPAYFAKIFLGVTIVDCILTIVLANTIGKK